MPDDRMLVPVAIAVRDSRGRAARSMLHNGRGRDYGLRCRRSAASEETPHRAGIAFSDAKWRVARRLMVDRGHNERVP